MKFLTIEIAWFLSFGETTHLSLNDRGLVLIEGRNRDDPSAQSNGSGKSALVDALLWCLYGITLRGYEGADVLNRKTGNDCHVTVTLEQNGHEWVITRRRSKPKAQLQVIRDGTAITLGTMDETQKLVDRMLGMTVSTFLNSVVFGQSAAYRFSALTDKQQKDILDEVLGTGEYAEALVLAREDRLVMARKRERQMSLAEDYDDEIERLEKELETHTLRSNQWSEDHARNYATAVKIYTARRKEWKEARQVTKEPPSLDISEMEEAMEVDAKRLATMRTGFVTADTAAKMHDQMAAKARPSPHAKRWPTTCAECGQAITVEHAKKHHADRMKTFRQLTAQAEEFQQQASKYHSRIVKLEDRLKADAQAIREARHKAALVSTHEATIKLKRRSFDEARERLSALKEEENPHTPIVKNCEKKFADVRSKRTALTDESEETNAQLQRLDFWVEAYGTKGIRSLLLDTTLPQLNAKASEYAQALSDGNIEIEFRTQSETKAGKTLEKFEVAVTNVNGAGSYRGNSAGERAKIDLCVGLAIQDLVVSRSKVKTNIVFFDEPFEALDDASTERVVELLTNALGDRESVFVITHVDALKTYFPNSITVVKHHGESTIEE